MMKKRIILCLLTGMTLFLCPALSIAQPQTCEAPPPAWAMITNSTPSSITIAWAPSIGQVVSEYTIKGTDQIDASSIPTVTIPGTVTNYKINNLKAGHTYYFELSASYCPGMVSNLIIGFPGGTGTIIVTQIIELHNPCTPSTIIYPQGGTSYDFSISQSSTPYPGPYTNALVAELSYEQAVVHFGVAQSQNRMVIGQRTPPLTNYGFDFFPDTDDDDVAYLERKVDGKKILTAEYLDYSISTGKATVRITFDEPLTYFKYCLPSGSTSDPHHPEGRSDGDLVESPLSSESMIAAPGPNPFSESTSFTYALAQELPVEMALYDPTGRLVRVIERETSQSAGDHQVSIDGAGLPAGLYFFHVRIGESIKVFSLVKYD